VSALSIKNVTKAYGAVQVLKGIDIEIESGEFLILVGPSGCGKSTLLNMIAGLDSTTSGEVWIGGRMVNNLSPKDRDIAMVFQSYALYPTMTVRQNISFGLEMRKVPKDKQTEIVGRVAKILQMDQLLDRKPSQLSGGQRQRVALARALVNRPKVLLLDEPLGALDLKLRQAMQIELKEIQQQVGLTFIYVTHDQEEALTMSDRLAVFSRGKVEQVGTPAEVYERPATGFVAGFVGTSNVLEGEAARAIAGDPHAFTIRPEKIAMVEPDAEVPDGACTATGHVREVVYLGALTRYIVTLDVGGELVVMQQNLTTSSMEALQVRGKAARLVWDRRNNRPVDAAGGSMEGSQDPGEDAS
jgi:putative spermidine/putrescine transport system ATP-binding protein